jgi:O-antigen/teichoic acid export membrane protein
MAANFNMVTSIVTVVAQCVVIWLTKSFLLYLITHTVLLAGSKFVKAAYFNKKFPILKEHPDRPLTKEERKPIFKEVKNLAIHQFSTVAIHSTDNIIISTLTGLGVAAVGLVSNYTMLINSVVGFVVIFFSALTTSFGNLAATSTTERYRKTFLDLNFVNFWLYGFCSIAFLVLIPPFITLWLGRDFLIDIPSFTLIVLNAYLLGQFTIYNNARGVKGNFGKDKWLSLSEALINLVVSVICAYYLGLVGVYIGTVASKVFYTIARPIATYRFMTDHSPWDYFSRFIKYFVATVFAGAITYFVCSRVLINVNIWTFIAAAGIVAVIPNLIFLALFFRDGEFKNVVNRGISIFKSVVRKNEKS